MPIIAFSLASSVGGGGGDAEQYETIKYWNEQAGSGSGLSNSSTGVYTSTYTLTGDPVQVIVALQCKAANPSTVASVTVDGNTATSQGSQRDSSQDDNLEVAIFTVGAQTPGSATIQINLEDTSGSPAAQDATAGVVVYVRQGFANTITFDSQHVSSSTATASFTASTTGGSIFAAAIQSTDSGGGAFTWGGDTALLSGSSYTNLTNWPSANITAEAATASGLGTGSVSSTADNGADYQNVLAAILIEP